MAVFEASGVGVWEKLFGYACLAGSAATNNYADLPVIAFDGQSSFETFFQLHIRERKTPNDALGPKAV